MITIDELLHLMRTRRSTRRLSRQPLTPQQEHSLLEAFISAPSSGNSQPWHVRIIRDSPLKQRLRQAALNQSFVEHAAAVFVICADTDRAFKAYHRRGVELYCLQDTAAATQNLLLAAHAMGLAACWVGAFRESSVRDVLSLPESLRPVAIIAVGTAEQQPDTPARRPIHEICPDLGG
ncbi:MAG TPA: nitroreductase family protein [Polyangiaceae bacterium]|jgi:nitroreductase|nr:MAG: NADPH-flavin oxidoreductase [Deltaproteobacteria bacterium ADurb.Bin207]HNS97633.1 nitroreductase family protein [Polyangiaceae bacterium]HNZ24107.1 nitroreductase family protein [Polyangiaceae bacterium]HOD23577.1 nitroreductase family protein [Polyangiaceae bacterium]HOE48801.1 nitroreductase family protein [Polyangiaceae bacterium]